MTGFIQNNIDTIIGIGTLISNILFVILILVIALEPKSRAHIYRFVHRHVLLLIFLQALFAIVGSLLYSQVVGFPPCELCWIQRIFIYPQAVIALIAMMKKDKAVIDYLLPLSVIGGLVALYHSFVQWGLNIASIAKCTAQGGECARVYVSKFGYITIPFMSFTIFMFAIGVCLIYYQARKTHGA
jgi:disulfide bond formation protein DsbB